MEINLTNQEQEKIDLAKCYFDNAKNYRIENEAHYTHAAHELKVIKAKKLEYDLMRKKLKAPILAAGKQIEDLFRAPIHFLTEAEQHYKKAMVQYQELEEKKILQAAIEYRQKQDQLANEALAALENGDAEQYNELTTNIINLPQPDSITKIDGISYRDNWKSKVTDFPKLVMAVATGHVPLTVLKVEETALNQLAKSTKGTVNYPGVLFYNDKIVVSK